MPVSEASICLPSVSHTCGVEAGPLYAFIYAVRVEPHIQAATSNIAAVDTDFDFQHILADSGADEHVCPIGLGEAQVDLPAGMTL